MVTNEVHYGCIFTGHALVFLHIRLEDEMEKVYYHLLETDRKDPHANESQKHDDGASLINLHNIALNHLLTFSIYALASAKEPKSWRPYILSKLKIWEPDIDRLLARMPPTPSTAGKPASEYKPDSASSPESPTNRPQKRRKQNCGTSRPTLQNRRYSPPLPYDGQSKSGPVTRSAGAKAKQGQQSTSSGEKHSYTKKQPNQNSYCTQRCLQGLSRGGKLDLCCPNVSKHCEEGYEGGAHQLSCEEFRRLLEEQLRRCYGEDFHELGLQGARGALFKVTLTSHGYTIVAKGTIWQYVKYLRHEAEVYRRLAAIQGVHVPVFLGSLNLDYDFYCNWGVRIVHMMFLSWSGESLFGNTLTCAEKQTWPPEIIRAVTAIHEAGILHRDMRKENVLWSNELKGPMVIDFERAHIVKAVTRPALLSLSANKKRKRLCNQEDHDESKDQVEKRCRWDEVAIMKKDPWSRRAARVDMANAQWIILK